VIIKLPAEDKLLREKLTRKLAEYRCQLDLDRQYQSIYVFFRALLLTRLLRGSVDTSLLLQEGEVKVLIRSNPLGQHAFDGACRLLAKYCGSTFDFDDVLIGGTGLEGPDEKE